MNKKKILILSVTLFSLLAVGCGNSKAAKQEKINQKMEEYARDYYATYILGKVEGLDIPEISIDNLENANANGGANYDLSDLKNCTKDSYARLILKENKRDIDTVELKMNCK